MATSSEDGDGKEATLCQSVMDETTTFYLGTLTFDLVVDIFCRLAVKVLMKVRCVCKSWNSLISDPKFAKEHLRFSRTLLSRHHLLLCRKDADEDLFWDSRLPSVFNPASTIIPETQLVRPFDNLGDVSDVIDSCDGIICFSIVEEFGSILLWNPSIRRFKILPPLEKGLRWGATYGFRYRLTDSYKVVVVCCYEFDRSNYVCKSQVMVHTLGTNTWRSIQSFPSALLGSPVSGSVKFVSGAINWLIRTAPRSSVIVALDLGNETSKELLLPNYGGADVRTMTSVVNGGWRRPKNLP